MEKRTIHPMPTDATVASPEVSRMMRDVPPAHYTFKIGSFSELSKFLSAVKERKYESRVFEVGGYKWRLSLYPNGDEKRNGTDHISLYLVLSETNTLPIHFEVNAFFKLFVYDHIQDKYLTVQDVSKKEHRFHALKTECGFSKFLPLTTFNDAANGYLVDDCCVFGAEIIVTNCTRKGESVSMKKPKVGTFTCKWENFSKLEKEVYKSSEFTSAGWKWCIKIYPKSTPNITYLGLFLELADASKLLPEQKVYVTFKLHVKNQLGRQQYPESTASAAFSTISPCWGFNKTIILSDLEDKSMGFVVDDTLIVVAEIDLAIEVQEFS